MGGAPCLAFCRLAASACSCCSCTCKRRWWAGMRLGVLGVLGVPPPPFHSCSTCAGMHKQAEGWEKGRPSLLLEAALIACCSNPLCPAACTAHHLFQLERRQRQLQRGWGAACACAALAQSKECHAPLPRTPRSPRRSPAGGRGPRSLLLPSLWPAAGACKGDVSDVGSLKCEPWA